VLVRIRDVSLELFFANRTYLADAVAQLWVVSGDTEGMLPLSAGDAAIIDELLRTYRPQRDVLATQAAAALARGDKTFTLELDLPNRAHEDFQYLSRLLERVDQLCDEQGLALPAPPEVRAFRQSMLAAIIEQLQRG
jgi:hypothetical protein